MALFRLSLDPGMTTAWALWFGGTRWTNLEKPHRWGVWRGGEGEFVARAGRVAQKLVETLDALKATGTGVVQHVYIEWPQYFDSPGGQRAAVRGDLTKLIYVVGGLAEAARERHCEIHPVPVLDWKGQLPKEVTEKRIRALLQMQDAERRPDHVWDAIGIGLYGKGFSI